MMYACVRQLHGAYGAARAEQPLAYGGEARLWIVLGHAACNRDMDDKHLYTYKRQLHPPIPVLAEQRERERAADRWYAEALRRKSEHKRKFDATGVDDIESSQEGVVDEFGTPLRFLYKKGFNKK